ncbi:MAG: NAD-dependent epimerase/dehydratase family protein [Dehalococcoidia bacterium]|nr:NAD-dependent epimerase/dehydratase family protein [Dehalococcoidia bacterium]
MKVLVTGGTGFVGSHSVAAIIRAGHTVRLLARSPERVAPALDPLGAFEPEVVLGDVTDEGVVRSAMHGCDAVLHAASVYSLDTRRDSIVRETNVRGTEIVLGSAAAEGLDPIIYVSSVVALGGPAGAVRRPDSPVSDPPGAYLRSKADSERVARRFQEQGAPVVTTYPGSVWGPHDPHLGESARSANDALRGAYRLSIPGGFVISDVRDVAALHAAALEAGRGPRRYLAPGTTVTLGQFLHLLEQATGRRLWTVSLPARLVLPMLRALDALQRIAPIRLPLNYQNAYSVHQAPGWDDSATQAEFGLWARETQVTIEETLRWMYHAGHIDAGLVGRISAPP